MKPSGKKKAPSINGPESFLDKGKQKIETEEESDEDSQGEEEEDDGEGGEEEEQESESVKEISKLDDEFYEIENVRKKRTTRKGEVLYLIKWRGWPETANTWEPIDNLQSCPELIEAFEERSDGKEVMVDNKYLKTNNPLLLIDFYEQHLRYSPV